MTYLKKDDFLILKRGLVEYARTEGNTHNLNNLRGKIKKILAHVPNVSVTTICRSLQSKELIEEVFDEKSFTGKWKINIELLEKEVDEVQVQFEDKYMKGWNH